MAISESFAELVAEIAEFQVKMQKKGEKLIEKVLAGFFESHPTARKIQWTQYTPYFNDGDECIFRVNDPEVLLFTPPRDNTICGSCQSPFTSETIKFCGNCGVKRVFHDPDEDGEFESSWSLRESNPSLANDLKELDKAFSDIQDTMRAIFGDHVKVTITREGTEVEEYEHE